MANFIYVRQKGPYGNGTPLLNERHLIGDKPFIYTFSDDFIVSKPSRFKQLIEIYKKYNCSVLGCIRAKKDEDYDRYGFAGGKEIADGIIDVDKIVSIKPRSLFMEILGVVLLIGLGLGSFSYVYSITRV